LLDGHLQLIVHKNTGNVNSISTERLTAIYADHKYLNIILLEQHFAFLQLLSPEHRCSHTPHTW